MKIFISTVFAAVITAFGIAPLYPQTADDLTRKGVEYAGKQMYNEALDMFRKAASLQDGRSASAFHNRGWLMEIQGNIPAAMENYQEAVRRNPYLADSYERMGYWFYKGGKHADAVQMGERVLKLDPANQEVKKWLPDAYKLKMENPQAVAESTILNQKPSPTAATDDAIKKEKPEILGQEKKADAEKKEAPPATIGVSFETVIRCGYKYKSASVGYYSTEGAVVNLPFMIDSWFKPIPKSDTRFSLSAGNPYLGAGIPQAVNQREKIEAAFSLGPFGIGGGFQLSHYYNNMNFGKTRALTDIKIGAIVDFKDKDSGFTLSIYPKGIPFMYTSSSSTGKTMDACNAQLQYTYFLDESISYYSRLASEDFYFYDNEARYSNYWGFYDVAIGLTIGSKGAALGKDLKTTIELGKRVYLRDLNNHSPYTRLNGQGYLGISRSKKRGTYIPGYHGTSNLFRFRAEESITANIFLSQTLMMEYVDKNVNHDEYALQIGVGGRF
jgi:tetratricopeptide (TPR) repeat protein